MLGRLRAALPLNAILKWGNVSYYTQPDIVGTDWGGCPASTTSSD